MQDKHLAKEAERLLKDDVLLYALGIMKAEAMQDLLDVSPDDLPRISTLQEQAKASDAVLTVLQRFITAIEVEETEA